MTPVDRKMSGQARPFTLRCSLIRKRLVSLRQNAPPREFFSSLASLLNPDYMRITHQVLLIEKNPSKFRASQYKLLFLCKRRKKQRVCQENFADFVSHSGQTPVPTSTIRSRNRRRGGSRTALSCGCLTIRTAGTSPPHPLSH